MQDVWIVITGSYWSGKTTLINSICDRWTPIELEKGRSPRIGQILIDDDLTLNFFEPPGTRRFDFLWALIPDCIGYIVVVDSTNPASFRESKSLLETFRFFVPVPYVVAANKQDMANALSAGDIHERMHLEDHVSVIPCVATDRESVKAVLLRLLYTILEEMDKSSP